LAIHSFTVPTFTLVYPPDIVDVPLGSQHTKIDAHIRDEVPNQIATPNNIVLTVKNDTAGLGNTEDCKLARVFDPAAQRIICAVQQANSAGKTTNSGDLPASRDSFELMLPLEFVETQKPQVLAL
jgi:hypothetical protein